MAKEFVSGLISRLTSAGSNERRYVPKGRLCSGLNVRT